MHHAFYIQEILLNIFSHCHVLRYPWPLYIVNGTSERSPYYANVHLATLARTCRVFKEPALDMIWAELYDLTPLVRCLPETLWEKLQGVYSLKKRLEQTEWDIVLSYAHRVRALPRLHASSGLAIDCVEEFSKPPTSTGPLFPNLRLVRLYGPTNIAPFLPHLANPKLTVLALQFTDNAGTIVDIFGERCPAVAKFYATLEDLVETISGLICNWQNLRLVECCDSGLTADAVSHLARSHHLLSLTLEVHDVAVDQIQATSSTLTFWALRDFVIHSQSLTSVWRFFHHLRVPVIYDVTICLRACPTATELTSFFVALREACVHHSLNSLSLFVSFESGDRSTDNMEVENSTPDYLKFDLLRPLATFVDIQSIVLDIPCSVDLSENNLLCLASSWPRLERFQVDSNQDWTPTSAITPGGFVLLLERCRSLRVFDFMFDTRGYTEIPQGHPWRGMTMPKSMFLHFLNSPIEEESIEALGVFFHVAPHPNFSLSVAEGLDLPYVDRWMKVYSLARDLWGERRDLRWSLARGLKLHP
ncbi:hypothetical protein OG21DRAFT_1324757 [Imleria badia]|nr:hypothetical protein OG21DRAFT_1324757 [Imleria badia]